MSDERQITSDEDPADAIGDGAPVEPPTGDGDDQDPDRIERLRALLTAPIKIPESGSAGSGDEADRPGPSPDTDTVDDDEYPAPAAHIPPHVRAAAEAAAQAGHPRTSSGTDADESDGPRRRTGRKRRTWADAFLDTGRRELPGADGDAATQLMDRLDELDRRTGEDIARTRARAEQAAETATEAHDDIRTVRAELTELAEARRRATEAAADTTRTLDTLRETVAGQHAEITTLTETLTDTTRAATEARTVADTAQEEAATATKKATTATTLAVVALVLALAAIGLAIAL